MPKAQAEAHFRKGAIFNATKRIILFDNENKRVIIFIENTY
jgi:hypothetical protein